MCLILRLERGRQYDAYCRAGFPNRGAAAPKGAAETREKEKVN